MKEKNALVTRSCVHLDAWFRYLKFQIWGLEIKFVEIYFLLENYTSLQREPFLTMFYTINLSPLHVIKKGFMIIIILSNYQ